MSHEEDLIDYSDEEITTETNQAPANGSGSAPANIESGNLTVTGAKGSYAGVHATSFRDFLLDQPLLKAITDCGFEHPSEVQQTAIPLANLGQDMLVQAKSGLGKTAVFVIVTLQQFPKEPHDGEVYTLVMCHTRELAYQIKKEYERFIKYTPEIRVAVFYGGTDVKKDIELLKDPAKCPHIVIGTPGRLEALVRDKYLRLDKLQRFVLDECDRMIDQMDMRRNVHEVFRASKGNKQVLMFSATLSPETKAACKRFMRDPLEIFIDEDKKLTLHGLQQYYLAIDEREKNKRLNEFMDTLEFNQVIIFVKSTLRCNELARLLTECGFPAIAVHSGISQEDRIKRYEEFKEFKVRICVATDVFGRGIDIERINVAINYDMPSSADQYLHRVGRAGRFGTKGLSISFVTTEEDKAILKEIEKRFEVDLPLFPDEGVDASTYMAN